MNTLRKIQKAVFAAPVLAMAFMTPAPAATSASFVNIPFAFSVGKKQMPPGRYRLERMDPASSVIVMTNVQTRQRAQMIQPAGSEANPRAVGFKGSETLELSRIR